jgi:phosphopantetheinyl transferase (holo-ACP synthase)
MNDVTLKEHIEALLAADRRMYAELRKDDQAAVATAMAAAKEAVSKAEIANERRFENTNEWRATYGDLAQRGRGAYQLVAVVLAGAASVAGIIAVIVSLSH